MDDDIAGFQRTSSVRKDLRTGFDNAMYIETSHVLQHLVFQNSPIMTRLLVWLLQETLAGRGDTVKSYTIAVEALGRPESFDSQVDSYPRVQTGRLRKALESYYSQHGPSRDLCLYLQPGSYRLRLAKPDQAYPQLYRPPSRNSSQTDGDLVSQTAFKDVSPTLPDKMGVADALKTRLMLLSFILFSMLVLSLVY